MGSEMIVEIGEMRMSSFDPEFGKGGWQKISTSKEAREWCFDDVGGG